ncbi:MAG: RagB/SusD family nutrient uptake outer membrane protein [Capnocytophaga sp.]|nr:RagB/SusD family nutrient uptake outer membrane protein [Capnocytophaga sp.]
MKKIAYLPLFIALIACDKYLDIQPRGQVIPSTIEDYDLILNGGESTVHTIENEIVLALSADDFLIENTGTIDTNNPDNQAFQLYSWGDKRFYNPASSVPAWNNAYQNIYRFNKVINEVMDANPSLGYTEQDKLVIQAEALYGRALDYFFLVNIFAPTYSSANSSALSVPIVTQADITQTGLQRETVGKVYNFIIEDLLKAIDHLPTKSKNVTRPNKGAGYALLSRVYLYKGDYQQSMEYATKALEEKNTLKDYKEITDENLIAQAYEDEQYAMRYFGYIRAYPGGLSDDLKQVLSTTNDVRYYRFFGIAPGYGELKMVPVLPNAAVSVGEMYVTRAECYARLGQKAQAIADLNTLRTIRLKNYVAFTQANFATDTELIKACVDERRCETLQSHIRLFDLKRLGLEANFVKTITHDFQGEVYSVESNSDRLVLPIPAQVLKFNPSW